MHWQTDWSVPWLAPWRDRGERIAQRLQSGLPLHEALNREPGAPIEFVPHSSMPLGLAYERYIFNSKLCPVRADWHDFFNGMAWLQFPQTKLALNRLQAGAIATQGVGSVRGPVRDAATLVDENTALLLAPQDVARQLWPALLARRWHHLFVESRPLWKAVQPMVFGHALLDKLRQPRKPITAHVLVFDLEPMPPSELDSCIAKRLSAQWLGTKPLTPLPVLGIPGWWPANEDAAFYADPGVFRVAP